MSHGFVAWGARRFTLCLAYTGVPTKTTPRELRKRFEESSNVGRRSTLGNHKDATPGNFIF